jgi:hypothetical protein
MFISPSFGEYLNETTIRRQPPAGGQRDQDSCNIGAEEAHAFHPLEKSPTKRIEPPTTFLSRSSAAPQDLRQP